MAKNASVFYKLPIEEMRGKLATKQDGIMYAGQEKGENTLSIGDGNHVATNFEKYIVVTRTRGKNRFYVKSRTTVANTTGTINTRAILALAMPLVDAIYTRRYDAVDMVAFKEAYEFYKKGETLREYLTKIVVESIRRGKASIEYLSKPNQQGVTEYVELLDNPYVAYNTAAPTIFTGGHVFGSQGNEAKIVQEYLKYRALQMSARRVQVTLHETTSGSTYKFEVVCLPATNFADMANTTQGIAFGIEQTAEAVTSIMLRPFNLNYAITGRPYLDAAKTQPVVPATTFVKIDGELELYI